MRKFVICAITLVLALAMLTLPESVPEQANASQELSSTIFLYLDSQTAMVNDEIRYIDETNKGIRPVAENGYTLVPVRFIAENLGMEAEHLKNPSRAVLKRDEMEISFFIGTNKFTLNGVEMQIDNENPDVISKVINDRTFVPLRTLTDILGKKCYYERGLIIISDKEITADKSQLDEIIGKINVLPTVGSAEYLLTLFDTYDEYDGEIYYSEDAVILNGMAKASPTNSPSGERAAMESAQNASGKEYSATNAQVEGVDESDVVKTDGDYIYTISGDKIIIAKINPVENMSVTKIIADEKGKFYPNELYIDGNKLVVIGNYNGYNPYVQDSAVSRSMIRPGVGLIRTAVYDVSDRANPLLERTLDTSGNYVSSRRIGDIVYIISNEYIYSFYDRFSTSGKFDERAAVYNDSAVSEESIEIYFDSVKFLPESRDRSFLTIASINITKPGEPAIVESMIGGGDNVYCSEENLFVAASKYGQNSSETVVYKFSLSEGGITYLSKCEADGNILNQFSMDESAGQFRIATTSYNYAVGRLYNNLYIYDDAMNPRGSIENIAPQERIYSVRFVGDRAYIVTFKDVDPLFVIDLSDIDEPKILGQLKIPGYSDYLHPVDGNHIIGFGKDTAEQRIYYGDTSTSAAFYQGMKMALFDVTDVTNPVQKYVEIIGGRGTDSALLRNHKALLYLPDKELLAFPVTVYTNDDIGDITSYGEFEFDGAYVYNFNTDNGFDLKGKITHYADEDLLKLGYHYDIGKSIKRILYANGSLFSVSNVGIHANNATDVKLINKIEIE